MKWLVMSAVLLAGPVLPVVAGPPDMSGLNDKQARSLLLRLSFATVAGLNCEDWLTDDAAWTFITDSADQLANQLGLTVETYDAGFYGPAFAAMANDPGFCEIEGPRIGPLIELLIEAGGTIDKFKITG